jgi:hypothetical protein
MPDTISIEALRKLATMADHDSAWEVLDDRRISITLPSRFGTACGFDSHCIAITHDSFDRLNAEANAAYIAAANPDVVLRLLEVAERALAYDHAAKNISAETGFFAPVREALFALHESLAPFRAAAEIARQASDRGGER